MQRSKESQLAAVGQTPCEKTGAWAVRVLKNIKLPKQCVLDDAIIYVAKRILCAETLLNDCNVMYF